MAGAGHLCVYSLACDVTAPFREELPVHCGGRPGLSGGQTEVVAECVRREDRGHDACGKARTFSEALSGGSTCQR